MKKFKFNKVSKIILAFVFTLGLVGVISAVTPPLTVNLGGADSFAILAGTPNITDSGNASVITGDVGLSPAASSGIGLFCSQMSTLSKIYGVDATYVGSGGTLCFNGTSSDKTFVDDAKLALDDAYLDAAGRTSFITLDSPELGGRILNAGVYTTGSTALNITAGAGPLVLDAQNNPSAVFIFEGSDAQAGSLTVGPGGTVSLINGASACNVFWRVYGATINTTAVFKGTIMALTSITVANGANIEGRLLARGGSVTLDHTTVSVPTCTAPTPTPTPTPTPVIRHTSSGSSVMPIFNPTINIISTPVVIVPKLPKTGFPPQTWYGSLLNSFLNLFR